MGDDRVTIIFSLWGLLHKAIKFYPPRDKPLSETLLVREFGLSYVIALVASGGRGLFRFLVMTVLFT